MKTKSDQDSDVSLFDAPAAKKRNRTKAPQMTVLDEKLGPDIEQEFLPPSPMAEGKAVAPVSPDPGAAATNIVLETLRTIERVSMNPNVNPEALDKIYSLQERMIERQARADFNEAFVRMAPNLPVITRDGRIVVRAKDSRGDRTGEKTQDTPYAKWETISEIIVPILSSHGFSLRHRTETAPDGKIRITAMLYGHGHTEESYLDFEIDTTGSKNNAQGRVSATTYGRRITACTVLNIVTKGDDDDGKVSGRPVVVGDPMTEEQIVQLVDLCGASECSEAEFLEYMNKCRPKSHPSAAALRDLPASRFEQGITALKLYEQRKFGGARAKTG